MLGCGLEIGEALGGCAGLRDQWTGEGWQPRQEDARAQAFPSLEESAIMAVDSGSESAGEVAPAAPRCMHDQHLMTRTSVVCSSGSKQNSTAPVKLMPREVLDFNYRIDCN